MNEEFYIGQIFDGVYPPEAAVWCNANNALIIKTGSVMRVVSEEYEETVQTPIKYSAITHIEIDESGNEHEIIDQPEHEEIIEETVVKTREVEKEVRQYQIVAIPQPTEYEKAQERIAVLKAEIASVDYKQFKYLRGELSPEEWEEVKAYIQVRTTEINELEKLLTKTKESAIIE